ncbi:MAG: hypothetical protein JW986_02000 [Methanotrichaceae archaeon]|nr:hypothetical protein [Methanotrichaceae archaeon]
MWEILGALRLFALDWGGWTPGGAAGVEADSPPLFLSPSASCRRGASARALDRIEDLEGANSTRARTLGKRLVGVRTISRPEKKVFSNCSSRN